MTCRTFAPLCLGRYVPRAHFAPCVLETLGQARPTDAAMGQPSASASLAAMRVPRQLVGQMIAHAREEAPNECCG